MHRTLVIGARVTNKGMKSCFFGGTLKFEWR